MNGLDVLLVLMLLSAAAHGLWRGASIQVLSLSGFVGGLALGSAVAPLVVRRTTDPLSKAMLSLLIVFLGATLLSGLGRQLGVRLWALLRRLRLSSVDSALGAVVAVIATLLVSWLVTVGMLATVPIRELSSAIQSSAILRFVDHHMPPAPTVFSRLQRLLQIHGLPPVFEGLEPAPAGPLPAPGDPLVRAALDRSAEATVKVLGLGCGRLQEGSGFVAASGFVITNAHVVAGVNEPAIESSVGRFRARPVLFDSKLDIAVLSVPALETTPLPLLRAPVDRGAPGAVVGYPGGGPLTAEPAVVLRQIQAFGRDIYGQEFAQRPVYELNAEVRPGNSGGPLVDPAGTVFGVVFSRSAWHDDIGYALTSPEVATRLDQAVANPTATDTGPCTS